MKRLLLAIPLLLLVVTAVFAVFAMIPGDPATIYAGDTADSQTLARVRHEFGLDKPLYVRYLIYLEQLAHGNMGSSVFSGVPVASEIAGRFGNTFRLALVSIGIATVVGMSTGTAAAVKRNSTWDYASMVIALAGISIPGFWLGLLMIYLFAVELRWFPTGGIDGWRSYVLPSLLLSVFTTAYFARITRSAILDVMRQDYLTTARAKGISNLSVLVKHALRNAIIPIVTVLGMRFGMMLTGSVITETIFAWPGLGRLMLEGVLGRDYPVIQGTLLTFACTFMIVNLLVDIAYAALDPRVKYR